MSWSDDLKEQPWRFDFYSVLRRLERSNPGKPRIGDSAALRDEYLKLGQDPFMEFPASNLSKGERDSQNRYQILTRFLGLLGPQGALPLATTEEAYLWADAHDDAFPRFLDVFNNRFLQLFYRAWADARPIAQRDRPRLDRFGDFVGAMTGTGSKVFHGLDSIPDSARLRFAGLMAPQAKSAGRLKSLISGMLGIDCEVEQFVGSRLVFDPEERTHLGGKHAALGGDVILGASIFSVQDKFRVRLFTGSLEQYEQFLPSGPRCEQLADLVFFYTGDQTEWDVELAVPAKSVKETRLGSFGRLGWTTWMAPKWSVGADALRCDSRFHPADRLKAKRRAAAQRPERAA